jgi:hypothetical protein
MGTKALNLTMDFDEKEVLTTYNHYLVTTLDVSILIILLVKMLQ